MRKALKVLLLLLLAVLVLAAAYVAYVFLAYHRIPDNQVLTVEGSAANTLRPGGTYRALSYNIGFGAYEDDYSFFMDGGTESWAWSEERLKENLDEIAALLQKADADFYLLEEVDVDATRTYHFDESAVLRSAFPDRTCVYAQNYDSPFLLYPFTQPHGASESGLMTFSSAPSPAMRSAPPCGGACPSRAASGNSWTWTAATASAACRWRADGSWCSTPSTSRPTAPTAAFP